MIGYLHYSFFFNNKKFLISRLKIEISQKCYLDYVLFLDLRVILIGFNSSFIAIRDEYQVSSI